ncbi:RNA polymerase sigma factor [Agrobacterium salinitolerans]|nr:RNA polymerase sigma factor [Agrobacterium salinitolerans]
MHEVTLDLIEKAASGDRDAFSRLVESEYDFVFKIAWKWTRNRTDAEDIAQEVCLRLAQSISKFKGYGRFRTWLYSLVLNVVRDAVRKSSRNRQREEAWSREVVVAEPDDCDPGHALWEAVRCLPDKQKDAVLLVYGEGLSHSQASEILGIAETTISWHLHEARKRLKIIMTSEVAYG